tara:strand:- start:201 stop:659 length:459 start_codon:yes stop_codon:yes gene_type:complete
MTQTPDIPREVRTRCRGAVSDPAVREQLDAIAREASNWRQLDGREGEGFREEVGRLRANDAQARAYGQVRNELGNAFLQACEAELMERSRDIAAPVRVELATQLANGRRIEAELQVRGLSEREACAMEELNMLPQHVPLNAALVDRECGAER